MFVYTKVKQDLLLALKTMKEYLNEINKYKDKYRFQDKNELSIEFMVKCDGLYYDKYGNAWFREFTKEENNEVQALIDQCGELKHAVYDAIMAL